MRTDIAQIQAMAIGYGLLMAKLDLHACGPGHWFCRD